jgi:hypothetical protein
MWLCIKIKTSKADGNEAADSLAVRRGGRDCRYRSLDTALITDPDGTADGTAMTAPMGLRWDCDNSPDGTAISAPMGLRYQPRYSLDGTAITKPDTDPDGTAGGSAGIGSPAPF